MKTDDLKEYYDEIQDIISCPSEEGMPDNAPVVAMFLMDYLPELPPKDTPFNMTSADIAMRLEDVCTLTISDVSAVMVKLGYRIFRDPVRGFVWSMTSETISPT